MTCLDVVTGFLGAGKTTFLARYVRWLEKQNIRCTVVNCSTIKPLDGAFLSSVPGDSFVFTMEEHMLTGGFGGKSSSTK